MELFNPTKELKNLLSKKDDEIEARIEELTIMDRKVLADEAALKYQERAQFLADMRSHWHQAICDLLNKVGNTRRWDIPFGWSRIAKVMWQYKKIAMMADLHDEGRSPISGPIE